MSPEEAAKVAEIRARWEAATTGPYLVDYDERPAGANQIVFRAPNGRVLTLCFMSTGRCEVLGHDDDAEFLAAAWADIEWLLAHVPPASPGAATAVDPREAADALVSKLHDVFYSTNFDLTAEVTREYANRLIWEIHGLLRAPASPERSDGASEGGARP